MRPSETLIPLLIVLLSGCGGGLTQHSTAKVTGKVVCEGEPVADVRVYFNPMAAKGASEAGKSGVGFADSNGSFTISTYGKEDGAVVGKHRVMVDSPHPEDFPGFSCKCETNGNVAVQEVEVTAGGENSFTITMKPKTDQSKSNLDADTLDDVEGAAEERRKAAE